jgi:hypothetical protein
VAAGAVLAVPAGHLRFRARVAAELLPAPLHARLAAPASFVLTHDSPPRISAARSLPRAAVHTGWNCPLPPFRFSAETIAGKDVRVDRWHGKCCFSSWSQFRFHGG